MVVILGVVLSLAVWLAAMQAIVWSWNSHVVAALASGEAIEAADRRIDLARVAQRHSLGWTAVIFGFFLLLDLADFPLAQRVGFGVLLALVYGIASVGRSEAALDQGEGDRAFLFGSARDAVWYRALAVADWAGYICVLVFVAEAVGGIF